MVLKRGQKTFCLVVLGAILLLTPQMSNAQFTGNRTATATLTVVILPHCSPNEIPKEPCKALSHHLLKEKHHDRETLDFKRFCPLPPNPRLNARPAYTVIERVESKKVELKHQVVKLTSAYI